MTAAELKASILDRAVRGELTAAWRATNTHHSSLITHHSHPSSRPSPPPASRLSSPASRLSSHVSRLSSPTSRLSSPPIDDPPYELPPGWVWKTIPEVTAFQEGPGIGKKDFRSKGIPLIRIAGMHDTVVHLTGCNYLDPEMVAAKWNHFKLDIGDTVISTSASLDKIAVVDKEAEGAIPYTGLIRFKMSAQLERAYFHWFIQSPIYIQQIDKLKKGDAIKHYGPSHLQQMVIPLPPLAEQREIVAKIEELMPLVEEYGKAESELAALNDNFPAALKKSILQHAVEGRLTAAWRTAGRGARPCAPAADLLAQIAAEKKRLIAAGEIKKSKPLPPITDDEKPFPIPESWAWVRWGNLSESIQYGYNAPAKTSGRIKMVRISDIQNNDVIWDTVPFCDIQEDEIETYLLKKNDLLFARTGGTVGKSFIVKNVPGEAIYAGYLIRTRYSNLLCPMYLKYFMECQLYWDQLRSGTIATAQPNCNGNTLAKMMLPLPPLAEQKAIVARVEELLKLVEEMK